MKNTATRTRITVTFNEGYEKTILADSREWAEDTLAWYRGNPHVRSARIDFPRVVIVDLPQRFYDDHVSRELPAGCYEKRLASKHRVALDRETYDELLSDARYYADPVGLDLDPSERGLIASARATVRALEAVEPPRQLPRWDRSTGKHEIVLEDGETIASLAHTGRLVHGPCRIEYRVWEDGGIDAVVHR